MCSNTHYIAGQWRVGRNFLNPLYEDHKASCSIYYDRRSQTYRLKDFGNDDFSGDCFDIVGKMYGLHCSNAKDFVEILKTINFDLQLGLNFGDVPFVAPVLTKNVQRIEKTAQPEQHQTNFHDSPKKVKPYSIVQQSFSAKEISFWQEYGIEHETLKTYKVLTVHDICSVQH